MGYYINNFKDGQKLPATGKAKALINEGAKEVAKTLFDYTRPKLEFQPNLVCVVANGPFDAAGYAFSEEEMKAFLYPDMRLKVWLIVEDAAKRSGYQS